MSIPRILALGAGASAGYFALCIALIAWGTERAPVLLVRPPPDPGALAAEPAPAAEPAVPTLRYVPAPVPGPLVAPPAAADPPPFDVVPPSALAVAPVPPPPRRGTRAGRGVAPGPDLRARGAARPGGAGPPHRARPQLDDAVRGPARRLIGAANTAPAGRRP